jgi:hypothetical protein
MKGGDFLRKNGVLEFGNWSFASFSTRSPDVCLSRAP